MPSSVRQAIKARIGAHYPCGPEHTMPRPARPHPCAKTGASCTLVLAKQVGYGNVMTMIRAFKRYENTTPGKYRENFEDGEQRRMSALPPILGTKAHVKQCDNWNRLLPGIYPGGAHGSRSETSAPLSRWTVIGIALAETIQFMVFHHGGSVAFKPLRGPSRQNHRSGAHLPTPFLARPAVPHSHCRSLRRARFPCPSSVCTVAPMELPHSVPPWYFMAVRWSPYSWRGAFFI